MSHVDAVTVNAAVAPKTKRLQKVFAHLGVVPVEIWLLWGEQVHVPLARVAIWFGDASPGGWAEVAHQLARANVTVLALAISKYVAVARRRTLWRAQRLLKPNMARARVVRHDVDNHSDALGMQRVNHLVELGQGSKSRVYVAVVVNVIPAVGQRRWIVRAQPYGVDTKRL